ncbi:hypothetical protein ACJRO7_010452, partial [Eucalyptus globulus]
GPGRGCCRSGSGRAEARSIGRWRRNKESSRAAADVTRRGSCRASDLSDRSWVAGREALQGLRHGWCNRNLEQ